VIPWSWHANPRPTPISPLIPLPPETQGDWFFFCHARTFFIETRLQTPSPLLLKPHAPKQISRFVLFYRPPALHTSTQTRFKLQTKIN
jgi:hypothetical protein